MTTTTRDLTPEALDNWRMDQAINAAKGNGFMGLMDAYRDLVRRDVRPGSEAASFDTDTFDTRAVLAAFWADTERAQDGILLGSWDKREDFVATRDEVRAIKHRAVLAAIPTEATDAMIEAVLSRLALTPTTAATQTLERIKGWITAALAAMRNEISESYGRTAEAELEN